MIVTIPFVKYIHLRRSGFCTQKSGQLHSMTTFLTVYKFLSGFLRDARFKYLIHQQPLLLHGGMDIQIQRDLYVGMPQNFAQAFYIAASSDTQAGKIMPEHMKLKVRNAAFL